MKRFILLLGLCLGVCGANAQRLDSTVSGTITDGTNPIAGVTVTIGSLSTLTDANGFYSISNLTSLSATVVPSKVNYLFIPASRTVSLFRGDVDNVNFVRGGEIRGSVDDATNGPVPGVTMTLMGPGASTTTTTTDADGNCTFFVATGYQYTLTPSKPEYLFSPATRTTFHQANITGVPEFLGTHVFSLSGAVMSGTQAMAGVTVRAQKGSTVKEALTDANGTYALLNIEVGTWTVWAVLEPYSFSPATRVITGTGAPVTNVNFQLNTFEVSGRVTEGASGLQGILMTLGMQTTMTDSNGWYSFTNVAGAYAVFPSQEGQTFNPGARTFTAQSGLTNLNFERGVTQVRTVTMTADRLALAAAVARGGHVQIFSPGTIVLTDTIVVSNDMVLESLSGTVTLDGANAKRQFLVETNISLTLSNLTLSRGMSTNGGAVYVNGGKLTLLACLLTRNTAAGEDALVRTNAGDGLPGVAGAGGAIYNARGSVCATNTVFMLNQASGGDGAKGIISGLGGNDPGGNGAVARGGAIFSDGSTFVSVCSFVSNSAAGGRGGEGAPGFSGDFATGGSDGGLGGWGHGGAIFSSGTLNVDRTTLLGNSAVGGGGGGGGRGGNTGNPFGSGGGGGDGGAAGRAVGGAIYSTNALVHVTRSTVAQNLASGGPGGVGAFYGVGGGGLGRGGNGGNSGDAHGGGVFIRSGTMLATNVTFMSNFSMGLVGGNGGTASVPDGLPGAPVAGHIYNQGGTAWLRSSIVAYGTNGHCFGTISDGGRNISSDGTCAFGTDSYNNLNPMLALLANNGGPTLTAALLPGSPAIDAVNGSDCGGTDQRGRFRPSGLGCDIGAFELFQPAVITAIAPYSGAENEAVTILGSSLMDATEVLFNGVSATILASTPGSIEAVVPVGATTGPVTVHTPNGDFTTATNFLIDGVAPLIAFTQPREGTFVTHLACAGTVSDVPSGIERVTLYIQRASDYAFWTGSRWGLPTALAMAFANGVWSPGAVTLPSGTQLPDGSYTLYAVAHDFARNTTTKTVNVTVDKDGSKTAVERLSDGTMRLQFPGTPGRTYLIEASTDLSVWQTIGSQTGPTAGILEFIDRDAPSYTHRFYRTITP